MDQDIYLSMGRGAKAMVADAIDIRRALERRTILHPGKFPLWSDQNRIRISFISAWTFFLKKR